MSVMLAVFDDPGKLVALVKRLRGRGYDHLETYSPAPFPELDPDILRRVLTAELILTDRF